MKLENNVNEEIHSVQTEEAINDEDFMQIDDDSPESEVEFFVTLQLDKKDKNFKHVVRRQRCLIILCVVIIILLLLMHFGYALFNGGWLNDKLKLIKEQVGLIALVDVPNTPDDVPGRDPGAVPIPDDDTVSQLNDKLDKGKMCVNMRSRITFDNGYGSGCFYIVNDEANNYPQFVTLILNSNNTQIYQSGLVDVGKCIVYDTLDLALEKGTYECTAIFKQVDPETNKVCGKAAAEVSITVKN